MTTWADILADLRLDMDDTGENPKLDAETAFLYGKMAIRDYSRWNPRVMSAMLTLDSLGEAALPTGFISMIEVRDPDHNRILPLANVTNPPQFSLASSQYRWWIEGGTFRMNTWDDLPESPSISCTGGITSCQPPMTMISTVMTFPDEDVEAIFLYIRAKYTGQLRSKTSRADRFKRRVEAGNTRRDNPLTPEEDNLMDEYLYFMNDRYGSAGSKRLVRQRR